MAIDYAFIDYFLSQVEGPCETTGYIPCNIKTGGTANYKGGPNPERYSAMGASGVTIATGCDLGQTDAKTLKSYGLAKAIVDVFTPYLGKKKDAAIYTLRQRPLVISLEAACQTDEAVHKGYMHSYVIPAYEKDSGVTYPDLPKEAQAVIMSICFQKGVGGTRRGAPITWKALCQKDWATASHELQTGFSQYTGRRIREGKLLGALI